MGDFCGELERDDFFCGDLSTFLSSSESSLFSFLVTGGISATTGFFSILSIKTKIN